MKTIQWRVYAQQPTEKLITVAYRQVDEHKSKDFGIRFDGKDPNERYLILTLYDVTD